MENIKKIKVVIVGGGFGGIYTARNLQKIFNCDSAEITLINKTNFFLFTPLLHEVATGGLTPDSIVEPVREVFRNSCINFVEDTVIEIKTDTKEVITSKSTYKYDYLVISTGAETNYFGTPGAKEYSFTLKGLQDAIALRNHILEICEKAVVTNNKNLLTCAIVGAGATGVELAAELVEYMEHTICVYYKDSGFTKDDIKVSLITATADIIAQFPIKMRAIALAELKRKNINVINNAIVTKVEPHLIIFKDGKILDAHTIIWVAGVMPSLSAIKGIDAGPKGRMEINEYLQNIKNPEIFAIGDSAGTLPMLAQVATRQGKVVANNINALVNKTQLSKYHFEQKILMLSLGQWYAIGSFYGFTIRGMLMWWIWRTAYLFNFLSFRKRFEIAIEWTINLFYPRDITLIK